MIARLEGVLVEKNPEAAILSVGGVGYEARVPLSTFLQLPNEGKTLSLRIHTYVRQDALVLYGFHTDAERAAFRLLLGVNGVGPRMALAVLSGIPVRDLAAAVQASNVAPLRAIPGVGMKTAQRILIELRDKLEAFEVEPSRGREDVEEATISALLNLGYPRSQAEKVVRRARGQFEDEPTLEDLVREALRGAAR